VYPTWSNVDFVQFNMKFVRGLGLKTAESHFDRNFEQVNLKFWKFLKIFQIFFVFI